MTDEKNENLSRKKITYENRKMSSVFFYRVLILLGLPFALHRFILGERRKPIIWLVLFWFGLFLAAVSLQGANSILLPLLLLIGPLIFLFSSLAIPFPALLGLAMAWSVVLWWLYDIVRMRKTISDYNENLAKEIFDN